MNLEASMLKHVIFNPVALRRFEIAVVILLCAFSISLQPICAQQTAGYSVKEFLSQTTIAEVAVSPSGNCVYFITTKDNFEKDDQEITLWRIDVDSSGNKNGPARPVYVSAGCRALQWSPDGRFLSFISSRKSSDAPQLFLLNDKQAEPVPVTSAQVFNRGIITYDWTPDSSAIIFVVKEAPS